MADQDELFYEAIDGEREREKSLLCIILAQLKCATGSSALNVSKSPNDSN